MNIKYSLLFLVCIALLIIFYSMTTNRESEYLELIEINEDGFLNTSNLEKLIKPNKLFDLNLKYLLNSKTCNQTGTLLGIIIVTSYFGNMELRSAMRRAFPGDLLKKMGLRRVFLLGQAPHDKYTTQAAVLDESKRFDDIIQGNFIEAYRKLTYKHLMGLKWASEHCNSKYILKMDDDIVINLRKIVELLSILKLPKNLLAGYILKGMKPIREPANKWYVTREEFEENTYPQFLSGWFYITNPSTSAKLVTLSHFNKYFWIDDLYVTGILARKLHIRHYDISKYFTVTPEFLDCCIRDIKKNLECDIVVGPNGGDNNLFFKFNEAVNYCFKTRCSKRVKSINETCVAEFKLNLNKGDAIIENFRLR